MTLIFNPNSLQSTLRLNIKLMLGLSVVRLTFTPKPYPKTNPKENITPKLIDPNTNFDPNTNSDPNTLCLTLTLNAKLNTNPNNSPNLYPNGNVTEA